MQKEVTVEKRDIRSEMDHPEDDDSAIVVDRAGYRRVEGDGEHGSTLR